MLETKNQIKKEVTIPKDNTSTSKPKIITNTSTKIQNPKTTKPDITIKPTTTPSKEPQVKSNIWENPLPNPLQEPIKKIKPTYKYVSKQNITQILGKYIPKEFIPTDRFAKILGLIFMLVVVLALVQFPFDKLLSGDTNITIKIGYPWPFLDLGIINQNESPLNGTNLLLDMLLYLLISYVIDVIINFMSSMDLAKTKEEKKYKPRMYKTIEPTMADKLVKKMFTPETATPKTTVPIS